MRPLLSGLLLWSLTAFAAHAWAAAQPARPNILLVLVDDAALMDFGVYGGEARTPNIDALAARGMMFLQHRTTPFCAPSRAMLLTGMDHHTAGLGTIREVLPPEHAGKPGYTMSLEPGVVTLAERLRAGGYRTYMTGKWHLGHEPGELPADKGFDRSFIVDASGADNWEDKPYLPYYRTAPWFEDREPAELPEDFYSSTFLVDQMIEYLAADADRTEPFLAYLAFMAVHLPVQAPRVYTEKYVEAYAAGWHEVREARWRRAQAIGLIREGAPFHSSSSRLSDWSGLDHEARQLAARSMAVNAGMLEAMDHELGRLIDHLRASGQFENTIVVVTSDNGPEAGDPFTIDVMRHWLEWQGYSREIGNLGERGSYVAIGAEWAQAASGPLDLFKFHAGEGGLRVPLVVSGPGLAQGRQIDAFTVMSDVAPTLLELAGVPATLPGALPMSGRSLRPLFDGSADAIHADEPIGIETSGQAALYLGDYKLTRNMPPHGDGVWRLFDIVEDPGETSDLSASAPQLKQQLMAEYQRYADRVGVLELPEGYRVEAAIARNVIHKMFEFYWDRLLLALVVLVLVLWGVIQLLRNGLRRG